MAQGAPVHGLDLAAIHHRREDVERDIVQAPEILGLDREAAGGENVGDVARKDDIYPIALQVVAIFGVLLTLHVWLTLLTFVAGVPVALCANDEVDAVIDAAKAG